MGKNTQRLGNLLSDGMKRTVRANQSVTLELGSINSDLSLKTDSLTGNIRPSDYMVDNRFKASPLLPGDRVLVAWAGGEPVIVAVVVAGA